ncbi:MAG: hypothetical protein C0462_14185 [Alcanivorax sp.]|nr:hypothetical protein [Alcanivorax sp.]
MAIGLLLRETMSGWLTLDNNAEAQRLPFAFSIAAFTTRIFSLSTPRYFRGRVTLGGEHFPCEGELTIRLGGPHYWLRFVHPVHGTLYLSGQKTYGRNGMLRSLITCPLTVFRQDTPVGEAEVAYRDSILLFAFRALRLVREENAYTEYGAAQ